jgi:glutamate/tyrosine decarboxylase-like PLP-dependent enzyme
MAVGLVIGGTALQRRREWARRLLVGLASVCRPAWLVVCAWCLAPMAWYAVRYHGHRWPSTATDIAEVLAMAAVGALALSVYMVSIRKALRGPAIVCLQAGNVNTGSVDPLPEACAAAHAAGAWVHIDGAFGLWAAAAPERAHLVAGAADADSWATDAHKWLNVPYDSGLAFVRDPRHLNRAMSLSAAYLPQGSRREPSQYVPELSRRARGVEIWAALRSLGRSGLAELIERTCRHARRFAETLLGAGFEILNDVVLNQVLVSFGDAETTRRVIDRIQQEGVCWCGETVWHGRVAMRISVSSWATTDDDVERSLASMLTAAAQARQRG